MNTENTYETFQQLQKFLISKTTQNSGIYFSNELFVDPKKTCKKSCTGYSASYGGCSCMLNYSIRKANFQLETFKTVRFEGLVISWKLLMDYSLINKLWIEDFSSLELLPEKISEILESISDNIQAYSLTFDSLPPYKHEGVKYVIRINLSKEKDYVKYNPIRSEVITTDFILPATNYRHWRASVIGNRWNAEDWIDEFILGGEDECSKYYFPKIYGQMFFPFKVKIHDRPLVRYYSKDKEESLSESSSLISPEDAPRYPQ